MNDETYNVDRTECPYCGYQDQDALELDMTDSEELVVDCKNCEKSMSVICNISITYTCYPAEGDGVKK